MIRAVTISTVLLILCLGSLASSVGAVPPEPTDYVIRVTSATPGQEARFEAAVLVKSADAPFQSISRKTPFELRTTGSAASAIFRSHDDAKISVEVVGNQDGKQISRSAATGRAIVVGNNLPYDAQGFITSF